MSSIADVLVADDPLATSEDEEATQNVVCFLSVWCASAFRGPPGKYFTGRL